MHNFARALRIALKHPYNVAACVLWLCSADASFVTGVTLPVDGGQSAGMKLRQTYRPGQPMDDSAG